MTSKQHARRLVWPSVFAILSVGLILFSSHITALFGEYKTFTLGITALAYFAVAWLVSRLASMALDRATTRSRPYPRLLRDLIAALLFFIAFAATASLFLGQGAIGALAGSGLILAMLGFAIRNVVADTLSGIALGVEGPFRIGDWIDIDGLARGKVIEIGWRTTRILTRDSTYMILPNSQIARQRITNYSAPRPQYRAQVAIMLDHTMPVGRARDVMLKAAMNAKLIQQDPAPDVRVLAYEEGGITYALRFWLSRFDRDIDCRDEVYSLVDEALREADYYVPHRRLELVRTKPLALEGARPTQ
ncbi:mechanosensitive ion channel family protein [Lentibacter sp. XHP0401]|jgi:small-conductance mechanosensitive channel|uniref:mechanosensitive ion channel family protein n=1 Tax=Lentibacter sp. XHP0401 TaxID=2984334 RepID=UPI0021E8B767|nr:mechanosensitive ion channel family protein [Lentibacter sp. XHP0401]MCV2892733.1 mechanosensitive ion channel family protein [Lentibacter sp. XHP0401]